MGGLVFSADAGISVRVARCETVLEDTGESGQYTDRPTNAGAVVGIGRQSLESTTRILAADSVGDSIFFVLLFFTAAGSSSSIRRNRFE